MKRIIISLLCILLLAELTPAQQKMPKEMQIQINKIPRKDYSDPWFIYNLSPVSPMKGPKNNVYFRLYEAGFESGSTKQEVKIPDQSILVGFYGFRSMTLSAMDGLRGKATDTNIFPCIHNLLCDVIIHSQDALEVEDISNVNLVIVNLSKNDPIRMEISQLLSIPSTAKGLLYLVWNKGIYETLPKPFVSADALIMPLNDPFKIIRPHEIAKIKNPPAKPAVKKDEIAAKTPVTKPPEPKLPQPGKKEKPPELKVTPPPKNQEPEKKIQPAPAAPVKKQDPPAKQVPAVCKAPAISKALYPLFWDLAAKQYLDISQASDTILLAAGNDTLIIRTKKDRQVKGAVAVPTRTYRVTFHSPGPEKDDEPLFVSLASSNLKRVIFSYKEQKMPFVEDEKSKGKGTISMPVFCDDPKSLKADWNLVADMQPETGLLREGDSLVFIPKKAPVNLSLIDDQTNIPIKSCYIDLLRGGTEKLLSFKYKPGARVPEIFLSDRVYSIRMQYPGYLTKPDPITRGDFEDGKTSKIRSTPSFHILYCAPDPSLKGKMVTTLEEHLESINQLRQSFLLMISNAEKPLVSTDQESAQKFVLQIPQLFDQATLLKSDEAALISKIKKTPFPKNATINLTIMMSEKIYQNGGEDFILNLYSTIQGLFSSEIKVMIYLDTDVDNKKVSDSKDDRIRIKTKFRYLNLLNE